MIRIKNPGRVLTYHSHNSIPLFDQEQKFSVLNFRKDQFYSYNPKYKIKNKEQLHTKKVYYSVKIDHIAKFLENQFEEDKHLLKKPYEVLFVGKCAAEFQVLKQLEYQKKEQIKKACTKFFNFYDTKIDFGKIVDSPSYGNGDFSYRIKHQNKKLLKNYITFSTRLYLQKGMDITDRIMFNYMKHLKLPIQLVFNKVDLVPCDLVYTKILALSQPFSIYEDIVQSEVLLTSARTGYGIEELKKSVKQSLYESTTREIFFKAGKVSYLPQTQIEGDDLI